MKGIDIASYQSDITNYNQLKQNGIDFAIIKITEGTTYTNPYFTNQYNGCQNNDIKCGAYVFSHGSSEEYAQLEANYLLNQLNGRKLDLPIFYDIEAQYASQLGNKCTDCAIAFGKVIEAAGYKWGVYSNLANFKSIINSNQIKSNGGFIWVAAYGISQLDYECDMWQYSESEKINGYSGNLDVNILYNEEMLSSQVTTRDIRAEFLTNTEKWLGKNEADGSFKEIIDMYNTIPNIGYHMTYSDPWCAAFIGAVSQKTGITNIVFPECACDRMIDLYKKAGGWVEEDDYIPNPGDIIFYDWDDSGIGDNCGSSDHVGIVYSVAAQAIKVIEGNYSDAVGFRTISINGKYIRGYGVPNYGSEYKNDSQDNTALIYSFPTDKCSVGLYEIQMGHKGRLVERLQQMLKIDADGYFGPNTYTKVITFQKENGLGVDGIVGPLTWNKLMNGEDA